MHIIYRAKTPEDRIGTIYQGVSAVGSKSCLQSAVSLDDDTRVRCDGRRPGQCWHPLLVHGVQGTMVLCAASCGTPCSPSTFCRLVTGR